MSYKPNLEENIAHDLGEEQEDVPPQLIFSVLLAMLLIGIGISIFIVDQAVNLADWLSVYVR